MSVSGRVYGRNLFDDELRAFDATVLVDIKPVGELNDATIGRPGLVEGYGIDGLAAGSRAQPQFEVIFADRALLQNVEITIPHRLRKTRTPRTRLAQRPRERQIQSIIRQRTIGQNCTTEIGVRIEPRKLGIG